MSDALETSITTRTPIGKVLVDKGYVSAEDVRTILERQVVEIIHSLVRLKDGKFFFEETEELKQSIGIQLNLTLSEIFEYVK